MRRLRRAAWMVFVFGLAASTAWAAENQAPKPVDGVVFESQVDKKKLSTDDVLTFTILSKGSFRQTPQIKLPDLSAFEIVSQAQRFNLTTRAGQQEVQSQVQVLLRPLEAGKRTLGPCEMVVQGKTYTTQPVEIDITQGTRRVEPKPEEKGPAEEWRKFLQRGEGVTL